MLNLATHENQFAASCKKHHMSSSSRERKRWQRMRYAIGRDGFCGKRGADVGPRIHHELSIWGPHRVHRILLHQKKHHMSSSSRERKRWQRMRYAIGRDGFGGKRGADVVSHTLP